MRKIEKQMIAALKSGKEWRKGNTEVVVSYNDARNVYLYNNKIAIIRPSGQVLVSFGGYITRITASRLTAILQEFVHANAYASHRGDAGTIVLPGLTHIMAAEDYFDVTA